MTTVSDERPKTFDETPITGDSMPMPGHQFGDSSADMIVSSTDQPVASSAEKTTGTTANLHRNENLATSSSKESGFYLPVIVCMCVLVLICVLNTSGMIYLLTSQHEDTNTEVKHLKSEVIGLKMIIEQINGTMLTMTQLSSADITRIRELITLKESTEDSCCLVQRGEKGQKGDIGPVGPLGPQGSAGLPGEAGFPGLSGMKGEMGFPGLPGFPGRDGEKGYPGFPGKKGDIGQKGQKGEMVDSGLNLETLQGHISAP